MHNISHVVNVVGGHLTQTVANTAKTIDSGISIGQRINRTESRRTKIVLLLTNNTQEDWNGAKVYLKSGTSDGIPPKVIKSGKKECEYILRGSLLETDGIAGILTYKINNSGDILVIYFKVSFFRHILCKQTNSWNARIYTHDEIARFGTGRKRLARVYKEMARSRRPADNSYSTYEEARQHTVTPIMTLTTHCRFSIDVKDSATEE